MAGEGRASIADQEENVPLLSNHATPNACSGQQQHAPLGDWGTRRLGPGCAWAGCGRSRPPASARCHPASRGPAQGGGGAQGANIGGCKLAGLLAAGLPLSGRAHLAERPAAVFTRHVRLLCLHHVCLHQRQGCHAGGGAQGACRLHGCSKGGRVGFFWTKERGHRPMLRQASDRKQQARSGGRWQPRGGCAQAARLECNHPPLKGL